MDYHHDEFQSYATERMFYESRLGTVEPDIRFKTDGDFLTGIDDEISTGNGIDYSQH